MGQDSEDECDWEEVEVPEQKPIEITISASSSQPKATDTKGISHAERLVRIDCHKIHTVALLGNAWIRNKWINDPLLHARLLSLTPLALQTAFATIHKSRIPDQNQRGRLFEAAVTNLTEWWSSTFFEVTFDGHIRNKTYDMVQSKLAARGLLVEEGRPEPEDIHDILGFGGETMRSPKSLMKHALMQSGSRDTSAQLFTALCRGMGIPARLVVSLQSVPWQSGVGKPKPTYSRKASNKGKEKEKDYENHGGDKDEGGLEEVDMPGSSSTSVSGTSTKKKKLVFNGPGHRLDGKIPSSKFDNAKGKERAKLVTNLRKTKSKGNTLGGGETVTITPPDPTTTPPVFWTEVFSRPDSRWIPVDPIRCIVNKRKSFDPTPSSLGQANQPGTTIYPHPYAASQNKKVKTAPLTRQENRMIYVVAFEEDGYARDVTRRYAKEFSAKVEKVQGGSNTIGSGGKGRKAWWEKVISAVRRPYRLHRDDVEDEELEAAQMTEGMPTTISGFKDHPLYVLTRHLKQTQVIDPPPPDTKEIGKFRGEPVYPRSSVVSLKTAENWMRSEGRIVKEGCQALKFVKVRAGTVGKMRELEVLKDELRAAGESSKDGLNGNTPSGEIMQGLYSRKQTESYVPDPVVDGKVPKNNFGNIDLYVPSMLPQGAAHVPYKGVAKIARKLGFDFAEAVTGFEFKKRRAFPIIEGVVIAEENETALLEAYWEAEQDAEEKARIKREERVIKQWTRLVQGLRIRQRLQDQYKKPEEETIDGIDTHENEPVGIKARPCLARVRFEPLTALLCNQQETMAGGGGGGFLLGADDVVQAFHLPKYQHTNLSELPSAADRDDVVTSSDDGGHEPLNNFTYDLHTMDVDSDTGMELITSLPAVGESTPKTMREMAEDAARMRLTETKERSDDEVIITDIHPPPPPLETADKREVPRTITILPRSKGKAPQAQTMRASRARASKQASTKKRHRDSEESELSHDETQTPPNKRGRSKPDLPSPPVPTRTLRPRVPKTSAQLEEEKEQEKAYRRATAM
ncbi:hypothetical protein BDZ94DRAFT_1160286 [Collybia nuda]|uniref:Rad4-domain-containing protein n=1 Tax=Collybia nuda TaxID=64659 RepID=A0A9P5YAS2_9AGAR|nr:hypothetical protein BDZ94DRAFT_1160286 [Collybia nuda]